MSGPLDGVGVLDLSINSPGRHSREVLAELGIDDDEYLELQSSGITQ